MKTISHPILTLSISGILALVSMADEKQLVFPPAPLSEVVTDYHETKVSDPYRGLEDKANVESMNWAKQYAEISMQKLRLLPGREQWVKDLEEASGQLGVSIYGFHRADSGALYFMRRLKGEQSFKLCKKMPDGTTVIVLDLSQGSESEAKVSTIRSYSVSPSEKYFSCGIESGGDEMATLHVFDAATGKRVCEPIPRARWGAARWLPDESGFLYSQLQELKPSMSRQQMFQRSQMMMHLFGSEKDQRVLGVGLNDGVEIADTDLPFIETFAGTDWVLAKIMTGVGQDHHLYITKASELVSGKWTWRKISNRSQQCGSKGHNFIVHGDKLFLITRKNAPNGKLIAVDLDNPDVSNAQTIYEAKKGVVSSLSWAKDGIYLKVMEGGPSYHVGIPFDRLDSPVRIQTAEKGTVGTESSSPTQDGILFQLGSWTKPRRLFSASISNPKAELIAIEDRKMPAICADLVQETLEVKSHDGELVLMSLVYRKGLVKNGKNPVLLIGYGSYGSTIQPGYGSADGVFLAKGGIKAVAHVRGGGAFGERWRLAGYQETKPNTWKDLIACAEALVKKGYASSETICAQGVSAGGITVGRAITEKPEAFGAAIIGVGLVDVVRAETTPNGLPNVAEFGSVKTEQGFRSILAMSAYHHVKDGVKYPPVLLYHGANDTRVEPWQSMKLAARMHAASSEMEEPSPVFLRIDYNAGHGSGGTARQGWELSADQYSFLFKHCRTD